MSTEKKYNFETFTDVGKTYNDYVSIRKSVQLVISAGTVRRYNVDDYYGTIMMYDPYNKVIGIKPTNDRTRPGLSKNRASNVEIQVSIKSFLDNYRIPYDLDSTSKCNFTLEKGGESGVILLLPSL